MILPFHTPTRDFGRNEWIEVTAVSESRLEVRRQDGKRAMVTRKRSQARTVTRVLVPMLSDYQGVGQCR